MNDIGTLVPAIAFIINAVVFGFSAYHTFKITEKKTEDLTVKTDDLTTAMKELIKKNERLTERIHILETDLAVIQKVCQERHERGKLICNS